MSRREAAEAVIALSLVVISMVAAALMVDDATPLLTRPRPDLRVPAGLLGGLVGFVAAVWVTTQRWLARKRRRFALLLMAPLFVGYAFSLGSERLYEAASFRNGTRIESVANVRIVSKDVIGRRDDIFRLEILSPFDGRNVDLPVDRAQYGRIEPIKECLTLRVQRASNGAARSVGLLGAGPCSG